MMGQQLIFHNLIIQESNLKKEDAKLLFEAIESLNDEQKTAYILKNIQGLKYKKISKVMKNHHHQ